VRKIKGKKAPQPYEKSRFVIQGYNDYEKNNILTQNPIIQRASQRLIFCIAPSLTPKKIRLWLKNVIQAYTQANTALQKLILARLPEEL
jgi:hypothetical protein